MSNTSRKLSSEEVSALMEGLKSGEINSGDGLNNDIEVTSFTFGSYWIFQKKKIPQFSYIRETATNLILDYYLKKFMGNLWDKIMFEEYL